MGPDEPHEIPEELAAWDEDAPGRTGRPWLRVVAFVVVLVLLLTMTGMLMFYTGLFPM